jgi:KDO2-lipid IV(A) lauroyltransferase
MADPRSFGKKLSHAIEGGAGWLCYGFFRALPLDWVSALGGWLARSIGPHVGASKRARINLRRAMPDLPEAEVERVIRGMWDNLGRVAAEFPHIGRFKIGAPDGRITVERFIEIVDGRKPDTRFIFFSGHYGNWEIATYVVTQCGLDVIEVYRAANNPFIDRIINRARGVIGSELVPKGAVAAKRALAAMQEGRHICMLVDQKMNDGIGVPFFGRDAMTAPALARLALRYDCTVVPCWVERIAGARFRFVAEEPLKLPKSGDLQADTLALMTAVNAAVERRVRRHPEQWFWLHRRWPD